MTLRVYLDSAFVTTITVLLSEGVNEYVWTIPSSFAWGDTYSVRVQDVDNSGLDIYSEQFVIALTPAPSAAPTPPPSAVPTPRPTTPSPTPVPSSVPTPFPTATATPHSEYTPPFSASTPLPTPAPSISTPRPPPAPTSMPSAPAPSLAHVRAASPTLLPPSRPTSLPTIQPTPVPFPTWLPAPVPTPFCPIIPPQAESVWVPGLTYEVRWEYFVRAESVNLELYESGVFQTYIQASYPNMPAADRSRTNAFRGQCRFQSSRRCTRSASRTGSTRPIAESPEFRIYQTLPPTAAPNPAPTWMPTPAPSKAYYAISGSTLIMCNAVVFGVVLILVLIAYCNHDERDKLPKVSVFFMAFSSVDFLDCLWVTANSLRDALYFLARVLAGTCFLNMVGTISAISLENDRFDGRNFQKSFGYPFITTRPTRTASCFSRSHELDRRGDRVSEQNPPLHLFPATPRGRWTVGRSGAPSSRRKAKTPSPCTR